MWRLALRHVCVQNFNLDTLNCIQCTCVIWMQICLLPNYAALLKYSWVIFDIICDICSNSNWKVNKISSGKIASLTKMTIFNGKSKLKLTYIIRFNVNTIKSNTQLLTLISAPCSSYYPRNFSRRKFLKPSCYDSVIGRTF